MSPNNTIENQALPMPITQKAINSARQFAAEQHHPHRKEQVYLNTLAVLAVRDYLKILDIETDLTHCDSCNPAICLFEDVADLYIKGLGKIECRPIRCVRQQGNSNENLQPNLPLSFPVPIEAREERIGYIAIAIDETEKEATLLGFSPAVNSGELVLNDLHSLDDFLIHLEHLSESKINLSHWLANLFTAGWESFEAVFNPEPDADSVETVNAKLSNFGNGVKNLWKNTQQNFEETTQDLAGAIFPETRTDFAFRSPALKAENILQGNQRSVKIFPEADVTRAKLIDLGMRLGRTRVALLVAIARESDSLQDSFVSGSFRVHVQLHPAMGDRYLPRNLKLALISDYGETLDETQSRVQDLCILLHDFYVEPNESFSIKISIDDLSVIENFVV
ncbi:MAG: DUF1822 family protein [Oscillatoriaceae cyanobacterium Prado104]|jgi:hypothetical protein|nr:DUF1822 family protein [Oscillatoriaceae cyanobacterium Prado104]